MKPFNQSLHDDINKLKELHSSKGNGPEYKLMCLRIMSDHNISRSTLNIELKKDVPGAYKQKAALEHRVPVSEKELNMVKQLMYSRKTAANIRKTMSFELGFPYSQRRLQKIKSKISREIAAKLEAVYKHPPQEAPRATQEIFHTLSGLDLTERNRIHLINFEGNDFMVSTLVVKDCLDHLAASASAGGMHLHEISRFEMETQLMGQLKQAKYGKYFSPGELKQLESIRTSLNRGDTTASMCKFSLEAVYKTVRRFSPHALKQEVIRVFEEISKEPD
ncbi:MAG: hypothetical protein ABI543_07300 [Ignavibacteria bacterium]